MTCKTRQAAIRGERSKPHYYIHLNFGPVCTSNVFTRKDEKAFRIMETWGAFTMKIIDEMPKEGCFCRVWMFDGRIWSDTMQWNQGELQIYVEENDDFETYAEWRKCYDDSRIVKFKYVVAE